MIVNAASIKRSDDKSFIQFFLFSSLPKDILSKKRGIKSIERLSRSSFYTPVHVVDQYPLTSPSSKSILTPEDVASFCFPSSGVQFRFLPRCAVDIAKKKGLVGKEGNRYQLHTVRYCEYFMSLM